MFNVLTEPGIRFDWTGGTHAQASLPGVYAALMDKDNPVSTFPALRPHQRHAWHAFLVQLARWRCTGRMSPHRRPPAGSG